jgi:hypothetical protein
MIQTDMQLQQAIEQIERLYRGLDSLRADVLPKNRGNFAVLAEGPLDEIEKLQIEISNYVAKMERAAA